MTELTDGMVLFLAIVALVAIIVIVYWLRFVFGPVSSNKDNPKIRDAKDKISN